MGRALTIACTVCQGVGGRGKTVKLNRSIKNGFINTIYNSQDMRTTKMSINK